MSITTKAQATGIPIGVALYAHFGLAGAIGCGVAHRVLTPVAGTFRQVIQAEGAGALLTGLGPTFTVYFLQGGLKFGDYEFWNKVLIDYVRQENAVKNRAAIYLVGSGIAEFFADIALCPLEAARICLVLQLTFANGLMSGFTRLVKESIVFMQVPYIMSKFVVYERAHETLLRRVGDPYQLAPSTMTAMNLAASLIAGVATALVSHPADTLLSNINKATGTGSIVSHLAGLAREHRFRGLFLGPGPRIVMVGR
ncbi:mitochondrial phosphate carrier protein [Podila verticillata]|nr:mitochondrial phosphate carrier protein [Podila verticillata]